MGAGGRGHSHLIRLREKREGLKGSVYSTRTKLKRFKWFVEIEMVLECIILNWQWKVSLCVCVCVCVWEGGGVR